MSEHTETLAIICATLLVIMATIGAAAGWNFGPL